MNINKNNYEEFFLLYVDNELSAAERKAVESFVSGNPGLAEELALLQQSKLLPDTSISFQNKQTLIKSLSEEFINHTNYEEFFILYADDELSEEKKKAVEKFAGQYPQLQLELSLLQKARIEPDEAIVFEGKEKLYKNDDRKVVFMPWLRIAAAVVVILFVSGLLVFKNLSKTIDQPLTGIKVIPGKENVADNKKEKMPVTSISTDTLHLTNSSTVKTIARHNKSEKQLRQYAKRNKDVDNVDEANLSVTKRSMKAEKNISTEIVQRENISQINTDNITIQPTAVANPVSTKTNDVVITDVAVGAKVANPLDKQIAYIENEPNPEDINIMSFSAKKNRMRGIFRKVSRVFEKTTNADDSRKSVLVGNFQIALK